MADLSEKTTVSQAEDTAAATGAAEADSNKPSLSKSSGNRAVTIVSRILTVLLIAGCVVMESSAIAGEPSTLSRLCRRGWTATAYGRR